MTGREPRVRPRRCGTPSGFPPRVAHGEWCRERVQIACGTVAEVQLECRPTRTEAGGDRWYRSRVEGEDIQLRTRVPDRFSWRGHHEPNLGRADLAAIAEELPGDDLAALNHVANERGQWHRARRRRRGWAGHRRRRDAEGASTTARTACASAGAGPGTGTVSETGDDQASPVPAWMPLGQPRP
jgi:hypothetical protein